MIKDTNTNDFIIINNDIENLGNSAFDTYFSNNQYAIDNY